MHSTWIANQMTQLLNSRKRCLNHEFLREQQKKLSGWEKSRSKISAWSYDMEGHAQKCVERYCELANKKTEQLHKVSSPCLDDHQMKNWDLENTGELSQVCSHIVLKCLYLALIGRPDILWSVNKLAGSVTKWTQACYRRLARLISYIHQTSDYRQCCHVVNTAHHCRLGLFQDSDFAGDLEDPKSTSGGVWCFFGSRTFVPIGWMCKKQTSVSHSSTEYDFFSLDAGLRKDSLPALDVWDMVIEVLRTTQGVPKPSPTSFGETSGIPQNTPKINHVLTQNVDLSNVDQVSANGHLSEKVSQVYIFEDNEAVIKMTIKGRSPTMRHVNNSQSCVGLVVRQNQCGSQDSNQVCWHQNQMADMLSKALSCRKDLKKVFQTIHRRWKQSRDQKRWILCRIETCLLQVRILKMRMIPNSSGVAERLRCSTATGNRCKRAQKVCPCTLKRGHKESQVKLVPSILSRMQVPIASGNRCKEHGIKRVRKV